MNRRLAQLAISAALIVSAMASPIRPTLAASPNAPAPAAAKEVEAPLDTPDTVVTGAGYYDIAAPKIFWTENTNDCAPDIHTFNYRDLIRRVAVQGSTKRTLYDHAYTTDTCQSQVLSNITADSDHVFWDGNGSLLSLSVNAVTQTVPTSLAALPAGQTEVQAFGDSVFVLTPANGIRKINKTTGASQTLVSAGNVGTNPRNFHIDGLYMLWMTNGALKRFSILNSALETIVASGVTGYHDELNVCFVGTCSPTPPNGIYVATGNTVKRYNVGTGALMSTIYTSSDGLAEVREIVLSLDHIFVLEDRQVGPANPFIPLKSYILRKNNDGSGSAVIINISNTTDIFGPSAQLRGHDERLYWTEGGALLRLPFNASALPLASMNTTSLEVTQGIQDLNNSVFLIAGKRTVARFHVKSTSGSVPGMTALLYRLNAALQPVGEPLVPKNSSGEYLTVHTNPKRENLDDSFLFELPTSWITGPFLYLRADLNPYHYPPENTYSDNSATAIVAVMPSPRLEQNFVLFNYDYQGTHYAADFYDDFLPTLSWLHRAYPLSDKQDNIQNAGPGLHTHWFDMSAPGLPSHLNYTNDDCPDDPDDDGGLCASDYINDILEDIDDEDNNSASYYGFMPSLPNWFARGQTQGDTSNGPSDDACKGNPGCTGWDLDTTIGDWYAAHEIGHQLGRHHPDANGDPDTDDNVKVGCGHSQDDSDYPYAKAAIGNGSLWGFDYGDPGVSQYLTRRVYPNSTWRDVMSYCSNQWISDYTFKGIYDNLSFAYGTYSVQANEAQVDGDPAGGDVYTVSAVQPAKASAPTADTLKVTGVIMSDTQKVKFVSVKHKDAVPTAAGSTTYQLRLLDGSNNVLATHVIPAEDTPDSPGRLTFKMAVPWIGSVRKLEVRNTATNALLGLYTISANAPVVSNVALQSPPSPVTGTVTLGWTASDADGDTLVFDVYYSKDNGAHFVPVAQDVTGSSLSIDSLKLAGSSQGVFKVVASDGANEGSANSPAYTVANKAPMVTITSPANGAHFFYGQLINFSALVEDDQTNGVSDANIVWQNQYRVLGKGASLPVTNLEPGQNTVKVTVTSATGLSTSATLVVFVDDDLSIPGATLSAGPSQVGFQFAIGESGAQTADVAVSNIGGGTLNWTATENAAWLSLSKASGTGDDTITLTVDPSTLNNTNTNTVLHLTSGAQAVDIVVTVSFGQSFNGNVLPAGNGGGSGGGKFVYLPILLR